jgi:hypothetical protein
MVNYKIYDIPAYSIQWVVFNMCVRISFKVMIPVLLILVLFIGDVTAGRSQPIIVDHRTCDLSLVPASAIEKAKSSLHVAYGHTSHGSQIITGMDGLVNFAGAPHGGSLYAWNIGAKDGSLDIRDEAMPGDLGNPDFTSWARETRDYLGSHPEINVIMWSWCGEVSDASQEDINTYLSLMDRLEKDYPGVTFVYMTGHLDGSGVDGNLNQRNRQIRDYCRANNKVLFDFADIESYDPDGNYYLDKGANDNCDYDNGNWAVDWQNRYGEGVDWYQCEPAHTQALNGNLKAYAAWWMFARIAGWDGPDGTVGGASATPEPTAQENPSRDPSGGPTATICFSAFLVASVFLSAFMAMGVYRRKR